MDIRLNLGNKVRIITPSCATQPYNIGERLVGKYGTVIWIKDFYNPEMQGVCVLIDDDIDKELISAWSYYTGKEFEIIEPLINYCELCKIKEVLIKRRI